MLLPSAVLLYHLLAIFFDNALAQDRQTFFPPSIPLAIRSPYFNVWHISGNSTPPLSNAWPHLWDQVGTLGWVGKIRIDGRTYAWMGQDDLANEVANVTDVQVTPTRSIFYMQAGPMNITVTYFSPVEPSDWVRQSLPFSYVYIEGSSLDGKAHAIQVYSDITADWLSGNRNRSSIQWSTHKTSKSVYHELALEQPFQHTEVSNQAEDGKAYYAMATLPGLTWQIGDHVLSRVQFLGVGTLTNAANAHTGPGFLNSTVFAIALDIGNITNTPAPVVWAVGYVRDPSVQYAPLRGEAQQRRPYFVTQYPNITDAIDAFVEDFPAALDRAITLDNKIMEEASNISTRYADLVSIGTRQTLGSLDITVSADSGGKTNASDVKIFMKDIGTSRRINPVERMYAAFPAFLYLNASIGRVLLQPLLEIQDGLVDLPYAAEELGGQYPVATSSPHPHSMRIEQTGNMLVMLYAYARVSGDGSFLVQFYNLTKRWADYLVNNALTPLDWQETADDEAVANMTNLALKGIIAVKAMASISHAAGVHADGDHYDAHADAMIWYWQSYGRAADYTHILGVYNQPDSWALIYNWYADRLLGTNLLPELVVGRQTEFYSKLFISEAVQFGLRIDNNPGQLICSASWTMFTSAMVQNDTVRDQLVEAVWKRASFNGTLGASVDRYRCDSGAVLGGAASPALGAMFAHLALTVPNVTITVLNGSTGNQGSGPPGEGPVMSHGKHNPSGRIIGGVVGSLGIVSTIAVAFFWFLRYRLRESTLAAENLGTDHSSRQESSFSNSAIENSMPGTFFTGALSPTCVDAEGQPDVHIVASSETTNTSEQVVLSDTSGTLSRVTRPPGPVNHHSKTRQRELNMRQYVQPLLVPLDRPKPMTLPSALEGSLPSSESGRDFSSTVRGPATQVELGIGTGGSVLSETFVEGLRNEVENLRRVMQEMRGQLFEQLPEYDG